MSDTTPDLFEILKLADDRLLDGWTLSVKTYNGGPVIWFEPNAAVAWAGSETVDAQRHADSAVMALCDQLIEELMAVRAKVATVYE